MKNFNLPDRMKGMKLDQRGYPIPYFTPFVNGKPDFRYQDPEKRESCLERKVCSICAEALLAKQFWFICGPLGLKNKIHSDAPMHEECARFALMACPHLAFKSAERTSEERIDDDPNLVRIKPDELFLVRADKIWRLDKYIKFRPVFFQRFIYRNNKLEIA